MHYGTPSIHDAHRITVSKIKACGNFEYVTITAWNADDSECKTYTIYGQPHEHLSLTTNNDY